MTVVVRFDSPGKFRQPFTSDEGYLYADAIFARDGILEYYNVDGSKRKELRLPEENQKKHTLFAAVPLTLEHPPQMLKPEFAKDYVRGFTLSETHYDKGGFVRGGIMAYDQELIEGIMRGDSVETSAGYTCIPAYISTLRNEPGVWKGERYDSIQEIKCVNHVCTTRLGRAGKDVRVLMDSLNQSVDLAYQIDLATSDSKYESQTKYFDLGGTMTNGNNLTSIDVGRGKVRVDAADAAVLTLELNKLDSLEQEKTQWTEDRTELTTKLDSSQEVIDSLTSEKERLQGQLDQYQEWFDSALDLLEENGYSLDTATGEFYYDKKEEDEEDDDDDLLMDMMNEKEDEKDEIKKDSIGEVIAAVEAAKALCPTFKYEPTMDSVFSVQKAVMAQLQPNLNLDDKSPDWVAGRYDAIAEMTRQDTSTQPDYNRELDRVLDSAETHEKYKQSQAEEIAEERKKMDSQINQPLAMSKP